MRWNGFLRILETHVFALRDGVSLAKSILLLPSEEGVRVRVDCLLFLLIENHDGSFEDLSRSSDLEFPSSF